MSKQFLTGLALGIFVSGAIGGIIGVSMVGKKAVVTPPALEAYFANQLKTIKIPEATLPTIPIDRAEGNVVEGGEHFNHHCASCHDLGGKADSAFAKGFYPPVANLTSPQVQKYSDEQLKWIVENGIRYTGMPGWKGLIDEAVQWKIVYYMRALADPESAAKLEDTLRERGKWKMEAPAGGGHHQAASEVGEPEHDQGEASESHHETDLEQEAENSHSEHEHQH